MPHEIKPRLPGDLLYDEKDLRGLYRPTLLAGDFFEKFERVGLVRSLHFGDESVSYSPVEAELTVSHDGRHYTGAVPGRFVPATRSLTGVVIPVRIFLALPLDWKLEPAEIRRSTLTIHRVYVAKGESVFDHFQVWH